MSASSTHVRSLVIVLLAALAPGCGDAQTVEVLPATPGAGEAAGAAGGRAGAGSNGTVGGHTSGGAGASGVSKPSTISVGGDRFAELTIPSAYDGETPMPLLVMLHGYGASGPLEEAYLRFRPLAEELGFFYVAPDGTTDGAGHRYWNATKGCCDLYGVGNDDEGYLISVLDEIEARVRVDKKRVYFFGHSNGGFMTYRMACHHADRITAVGVLAGSMPIEPDACKPSEPVSVLHIHGTADDIILYGGGSIAVEMADKEPYPGAQEDVDRWRVFDGCSDIPPLAFYADYEITAPGAETLVATYQGCQRATHVGRWTMDGVGHIPSFNANFTPAVASFLLGHTKQ